MKVDLGLTGVPLHEVAARTDALAALGADGVYCAEGPHDIFVPLTLAAGRAPLSITTNAAVALPRNPIHLAHAAYDLQALSGGQFRLGLAPQVQAHITKRFGVEWSSPVARMRELVGALRAIFATWQDGTPLQFEGEYYRHTLMTPMFSPGATPFGSPPILLGALGPRIRPRMTAEVADGIVILPFNSRRSLTDLTLASVQEGLARRDPNRSAFEVVCGAIVGLGETAEELDRAHAGVRALLGFYGSTPAYRRVLDIEGKGDLQGTLSTLIRRGRWAELGDHVPDDLVDALAIFGTPQECAERLKAKTGDLADRVALFTPTQPSDAALGELIRQLRD